MIVLGLVPLIVFFGVLALTPTWRKAIATRWRLVVIICVLYLGGLFFHPYVFGLRGRIAESIFEKQLHVGMTRADVITLAQHYGGSNPFNPGLGHGEEWDTHSPGAVYVVFTDWETLCIGNGNEYELYFSANSRLLQWKVQPWGNAC